MENTGKRVLKSLAGSVTLIGALLVFLHLRYDKKFLFSQENMLVQNAFTTLLWHFLYIILFWCRRKRDRERSSRTVLPLPAQELYKEVYTNKKVEMNNYDKRYPGERLKL